MDDESVSDVREMFPESELCDELWWCRWLMSHGPATGAVMDGAGPLNHFAAATCR